MLPANPNNIHLIYATCESLAQAREIGSTLVSLKLVACVNLLPGVVSIYKWEGKLQESSEVVLIAKTTRELCQQTIEEITRLHSYDCPAVVAIPLVAGHSEFLNWVAESLE